MPDTAPNQKAYPQKPTQKPGIGFPIARIGALTSLSCGAIIAFGFCRYAGKGQGEVSLLQRHTLQTLEAFHPLIALYSRRGAQFRFQLYTQILDAIIIHRVANRPDRFEPRLKKRRPKAYDRLMRPRNQMKREMLKGNFA